MLQNSGRRVYRVARRVAAFCIVLALAGCGTYVPHQTEFWEGPELTNDMAVNIKKHIFCETVEAIKFVNKNLTVDGHGALPPEYGVQMQIGLTVEEVSALNPGVTLNHTLPNASVAGVTVGQMSNVGLGGTLSSTATRTDTSYSYYLVGKIAGDRDNLWCQKLRASHDASLLEGDLGISSYLKNAVKAAVELHSSEPIHGTTGLKVDIFSYEVKFIVVSSGNVTPSWKLVTISANTGNLPLVSGGRTRTHDLVLTFGPGGPSSPTLAALQTHFTSQVVQSNQRRNGN
jgi:hypothetical protein